MCMSEQVGYCTLWNPKRCVTQHRRRITDDGKNKMKQRGTKPLETCRKRRAGRGSASETQRAIPLQRCAAGRFTTRTPLAEMSPPCLINR